MSAPNAGNCVCVFVQNNAAPLIPHFPHHTDSSVSKRRRAFGSYFPQIKVMLTTYYFFPLKNFLQIACYFASKNSQSLPLLIYSADFPLSPPLLQRLIFQGAPSASPLLPGRRGEAPSFIQTDLTTAPPQPSLHAATKQLIRALREGHDVVLDGENTQPLRPSHSVLSLLGHVVLSKKSN